MTLTFDPKNNWGHLIDETNHLMKFEYSGSNGSPVIEWKQSLHKWPLWPWPLTLKTLGILYSLRPIILWSLKTLGQMVLLLLRGNDIYISGPCDLDLWAFDPENNRDPLLTETNHPMKFEDLGSNGFPVIEWKRYLHKWPLWP